MSEIFSRGLKSLESPFIDGKLHTLVGSRSRRKSIDGRNFLGPYPLTPSLLGNHEGAWEDPLTVLTAAMPVNLHGIRAVNPSQSLANQGDGSLEHEQVQERTRAPQTHTVSPPIDQRTPQTHTVSPPIDQRYHSLDKRTDKNVRSEIGTIVLAAFKDIMRSKTEAGVLKGTLETRTAQVKAAQYDTDIKFRELAVQLESLSVRDENWMKQARGVVELLNQYESQCQLWKHRAEEMDRTVDEARSRIAAEQRAMAALKREHAAHQATTSAMLQSKVQELEETNNDARTLAKFCEDLTSREEDLRQALEHARAETNRARVEMHETQKENQTLNQLTTQWNRDKKALENATSRESGVHVQLVQARQEIAKLQALSLDKDKALEDMLAELQHLRKPTPNPSATVTPRMDETKINDRTVLSLMEIYGRNRGSGEGRGGPASFLAGLNEIIEMSDEVEGGSASRTGRAPFRRGLGLPLPTDSPLKSIPIAPELNLAGSGGAGGWFKAPAVIKTLEGQVAATRTQDRRTEEQGKTSCLAVALAPGIDTVELASIQPTNKVAGASGKNDLVTIAEKISEKRAIIQAKLSSVRNLSAGGGVGGTAGWTGEGAVEGARVQGDKAKQSIQGGKAFGGEKAAVRVVLPVVGSA